MVKIMLILITTIYLTGVMIAKVEQSEGLSYEQARLLDR